MAEFTNINFLSFNQDNSCFTVGTDHGFRIYYMDPLVEKRRVGHEMVGSIGQIEMLGRSNFASIVGGGSQPKFADNTVLVYNDRQTKDKKLIFEIVFNQAVRGVRLCDDRIIVMLLDLIHVFNFPNNVKTLCTIETGLNKRGLCELNTTQGKHLLIFPGKKLGSIQFVELSTLEKSNSTPVTINAHKNTIACMALNQQGDLVATASEKGTLIRLFDTDTKRQVLELRRGADPATLYCIRFSLDSAFLCVSSDKGTVHVFAVKDTSLNRKSSFRSMGFLGQYGESQWGLTNFTVAAECACICAFGPNNAVYAVCVDGTFHKYIFNTEGSCKREGYNNFLDLGDLMNM